MQDKIDQISDLSALPDNLQLSVYWNFQDGDMHIAIMLPPIISDVKVFDDTARLLSTGSELCKLQDVLYSDQRIFNIELRNHVPTCGKGLPIHGRGFLRFCRNVALKVHYTDRGERTSMDPFLHSFGQIMKALSLNPGLQSFSISVNLQELCDTDPTSSVQTIESSRYLVETARSQLQEDSDQLELGWKVLEKVTKVMRMRARAAGNSAQYSYLLEMPAELRLNLFRYLWDHDPETIIHVEGDSLTRESLALPNAAALTRVCRQLHREIDDVLYHSIRKFIVILRNCSEKITGLKRKNISMEFSRCARRVDLHVNFNRASFGIKSFEQNFRSILEILQTSEHLRTFKIEIERAALKWRGSKCTKCEQRIKKMIADVRCARCGDKVNMGWRVLKEISEGVQSVQPIKHPTEICHYTTPGW